MQTWVKTWGRSRRVVYTLCGFLFFQAMLVSLGAHYDHHDDTANQISGSMSLDIAGLDLDGPACDTADHCCHSQLPILALPSVSAFYAAATANEISLPHARYIPSPPVATPFRPPIV